MSGFRREQSEGGFSSQSISYLDANNVRQSIKINSDRATQLERAKRNIPRDKSPFDKELFVKLMLQVDKHYELTLQDPEAMQEFEEMYYLNKVLSLAKNTNEFVDRYLSESER